MEKIFSIGDAARLVGMTAETLRHYDRIGLVKPCKTDEWTGYRYYTEQELVRLSIVRALRCMDLSLEDIRGILDTDDFGFIVDSLAAAENRADEKIAELTRVKAQIGRARAYYEDKTRREAVRDGFYVRVLPARTVLLSRELSEPTAGSLWNYHRHFFAQVGEDNRGKFEFEDLAGVYASDVQTRLFAVCTRFAETDGLLTLPAGEYLCAECTVSARDRVLSELRSAARSRGLSVSDFSVSLVKISGMMQWTYELQFLVRPQ